VQMQLVAVAAGLALGCVLGLLGGGGGLIAVPMFGALFGWTIDDSGTASMACVLAGSAVAVATQRKTGLLQWRLGIGFGLLGFIGAAGGSRLAFHVPDLAQHLGLASLLVVSGVLMLRKAQRLRAGTALGGDPSKVGLRVSGSVILTATGIGLVVGMFGISGGFLTVPALVSVIGLAVPQATATALIVVMFNSIVALGARVQHIDHVGATVLLAAATAAGAVIGALLSRRTSALMLATSFGMLMLGIALWELSAAIRMA